MIRTRSTLLAALCAAASILVPEAAAQTTHTVIVGGPGLTNVFTPANLTIVMGDTVTWDWDGGFHDVESGAGGIPDGNFDSGAPTFDISTTYSVTFDAAYLAANPMPSNLYPYYCSTHETVGMTGSIQVLIPPASAIFGCGVNPPGSLSILSGGPKIGVVMNVGVHNPIGTQTPGASIALLTFATAPGPLFPCGIPIGGFGMSAPGAAGEILLSLTPPNPIFLPGTGPWMGVPKSFAVPFPANPSLPGMHVYFQGGIFDPIGPVTIGVTVALDATIGN